MDADGDDAVDDIPHRLPEGMSKVKKRNRDPPISGNDRIRIKEGVEKIKRAADLIKNDDQDEIVQNAEIGSLRLCERILDLQGRRSSQEIDRNPSSLSHEKRNGSKKCQNKSNEQFLHAKHDECPIESDHRFSGERHMGKKNRSDGDEQTHFDRPRCFCAKEGCDGNDRRNTHHPEEEQR